MAPTGDPRLRRSRRKGRGQRFGGESSVLACRAMGMRSAELHGEPWREAEQVRGAEQRRNTWIVVPCKGRLSFLRQTLPLFLENTDFHVCLVDYSCPDRCGDWLETQDRFSGQLAAASSDRKLVVERVLGASSFNKSAAHNAGAWRAIREGAESLCFVDADTLLHPGSGEKIRRLSVKSGFVIAGLSPEGRSVPSTTGFLVVGTSTFAQVGGFDESFQGWGGEDIEMRLRLHYLAGLDFCELPLQFLSPIAHSDGLRTEFYQQSDIFESNRANMARIREKMADWGAHCDASEIAGRLWFCNGSGTRRAG